MIQPMLIICPIAGVGSRLFPITKDKPKAMLKVAGKRIIDHLMDKIGKTFPNGTRICFIVGFCKEQLVEYIENNYHSKYKLIFVEQHPTGFKKKYPFYSGLGDALALAAEYGRDDDCFIILPDRFPLEDYTPIIETTEEKQLDGCINAQLVEDPQHYGVLVLNSEGNIDTIIEKPKELISNIAVSGAYYFRKTLSSIMFDMLEEQSKQSITDFKEHHFTSIIQNLIEKGFKIGHNLMKRPVLDFGRPENLLQANKALIDEIDLGNTRFFLGKETKLNDSNIGDYTSIGNNSILENCVIENAIIGDNCKLKNVTLKNAILDDDSTNSNYQNRLIQL